LLSITPSDTTILNALASVSLTLHEFCSLRKQLSANAKEIADAIFVLRRGGVCDLHQSVEAWRAAKELMKVCG
jgi:hypothetical protein